MYSPRPERTIPSSNYPVTTPSGVTPYERGRKVSGALSEALKTKFGTEFDADGYGCLTEDGTDVGISESLASGGIESGDVLFVTPDPVDR